MCFILDERDVFEKRWQKPSAGWPHNNGMAADLPHQDLIISDDDDPTLNKSFFKKLFQLGFPGFPAFKS